MFPRNALSVSVAFATVVVAQSLPPVAALDAPYQVRYAVNFTTEAGGGGLNLDAYFNIVNDGANGAGAYGSGIGSSSVGNICANVYVFDNQEQMLWCCSCPVTPDETIAFSLARDILSNPLTIVPAGSVTVKLVATAPNGNCSQSAAFLGSETPVSGMLAWGTSPHLINRVVGQTAYFETETPFLPAILSAGETISLTNQCSFVLANGSGYGTCASCATTLNAF